MTTDEAILVRTEIINIATVFLKSAFNGLRLVKNDKFLLSKLPGVLSQLNRGEPGSYNYTEATEPRPISRTDQINADRLSIGQPKLNLTQRQGHILYLRAHCKLSWSKIADIQDMEWSKVRSEYDDAAIKVYYGLIKNR